MTGRFARLAMGLGLLSLTAVSLHAQTTMEKDFLQPPDTAKPRVWWHWLSGNVTQEGITADLEWMHRVDIGGFQMFDGDLATPRFVEHPLIWMTPEWKAAWHHAAEEAARLHLDMGMAASGGWSETAGPWVQPQQGMKKYVWSETLVSGPARIHQQLAAPPSTVGRYQTMPSTSDLFFPTPTDLPGTLPPLQMAAPAPTAPFYRDFKVVAYRRPPAEATPAPVITSNSATPLALVLLNGRDLSKTTLLTVPPGSPDGWIQFAYPRPVTTYGMTVGVGIAGGFLTPHLPQGVIECSDDGQTWKKLADLPGAPSSASGAFTLRTYAYAPVTASFYRLRVAVPAPNGIALALGSPQARGISLSEAILHTAPRIQQWEDKAAFGVLIADSTSPTPASPAAMDIAEGDVLDLTSRMRPDGTLDWQAPAGDWTILRFGYALTGEKNHPATPAATGLEVDKFSKADVTAYTRTYTSMISSVAGEFYGKSFREFLMDSWEAGNANWTERMAEEFQARRGYSLVPYLPALTGRVVGSAEQSDAFLWDFRRTLAELLAENHYGTFTSLIKPSGLALYSEAMGTDLPTTGDGLLNKGNVTVPMGEFWTPAAGQADLPTHAADIREAASAAHIYGKPIAAAESFTTAPDVPGWAQSPFYLKPLADENFARGINRIIIHTSDQQPFVDEAHKPGLTLGPFGQNYTRNITWAEQAIAWNTYLARTSFLLQQGSYSADVAYFYGEGAPVVVPFWKPAAPAVPTHYGYDYVNADILLHHASVRDNLLQLDGKMSYRLLVLPADMQRMTLELLRKLDELVEAGMILSGPHPQASPSVADEPSKQEYQRLAARLWGQTASPAGHIAGRGKVFPSGNIEALLQQLSISPDLAYTPPTHVGAELTRPMPRGFSNDDLVWIHRHSDENEIYFLSTQKKHAFDTEVTFRVAGRLPAAWNPMTGERRELPYSVHDGLTTVPIHFEADGSTFVVFGARTSAQHADTVAAVPVAGRDLSQGWTLAVPGAASGEAASALQSWTEFPDPAIKYFSGTALYRRTLDLTPEDLHDELLLDLGDVREIAEVSINGKPVDRILWAPPYRVALGKLVHAGKNDIAVRVTNLWPNRLIGDAQPGVTSPTTFTGIHAYNKDSPLLPSGMLGPVTLMHLP